jgi:hypothetical protein
MLVPPLASGGWVVTAPPGNAIPVVVGPASDQDRLLLSVLRLLDRALGHTRLSPVDRAFVAGARVIFERLAAECQAMLDHDPWPPPPAPARRPKASRTRKTTRRS